MEIQESGLTEFNVANEEYNCPEKRKERYDSWIKFILEKVFEVTSSDLGRFSS